MLNNLLYNTIDSRKFECILNSSPLRAYECLDYVAALYGFSFNLLYTRSAYIHYKFLLFGCSVPFIAIIFLLLPASLTALFKHIGTVDEPSTDESIREKVLSFIRDKVGWVSLQCSFTILLSSLR